MSSNVQSISGRVVDRARGIGLAGVAVSDGVSVVKTDERGMFTLRPADDARFVFIATPGQYLPVGPFYRELTADIVEQDLVFELEPSPVGDEFYFAQLSDVTLSAFADFKPSPRRLQPIEQRAVLRGTVRAIASLNPRPRFMALTGDQTCGLNKLPLAKARQQMELYIQERKQFDLPAYDVIGNHDHALISGEGEAVDVPEFGAGLFEAHLGPTYYSFNCGRWHFVVLNTYELEGRKFRYRVGPQRLNWLEADLAAADSAPTVVFAHEELSDTEDRDRLVGVFEKHNVKAFVSGHLHTNLDYFYGGVRCLVTGALCAGWWWRDQWATPRGYGLFHIKGNDLDRFYAKCGDPNAVHILRPESWSVISGETEVAAAVLEMSGPPATVTCQIGEADFVPMQKTGNGPWPTWTYKFNSAEHPDGSIRLRIRTVNRYGRTETYHRYVVVKNQFQPIGTADGELLFTAQGSKAPSEVRLNGEKIGTLPHPIPEETEVRFTVPASLVHRTNVVAFEPARLEGVDGEFDRFEFKDLRIRFQGRDYFRAGFRPHAFSVVRADRDDPRAPREVPCVIPPPEQVETMVLKEY